MYSRIYVRNRQALRGYKYRFVGKPYAVKLEPYQRKSMEWYAVDHNQPRHLVRKSDGALELERYEDKDGLYVILQPFRITGYNE
jgi:hypothetical protein